MNSKAKVFELDLDTLKPVKKNVATVVNGTEPGHFYQIRFQINDLMAGARKLSEDVTTAKLVDGPEYRIRIVPINNKFSVAEELALNGLGYTVKTHNGEIHTSIVTNRAASLFKLTELMLDFIA